MSLLLVSASSCNDFLDTVPDNRTEINSSDKIPTLLVSAYPQYLPVLIGEMSSDNVMDNGGQYDALLLQSQLYHWEDVTETESDAVNAIWQGCYNAIASANKALEGIEDLGSPASLNPQKGEALVCRAYSHFILATTFCMPYNPETAANELGIPYITKSGTVIEAVSERGTLQEDFDKIAEDLEAGIPLIKDNVYKVPSYHFNKKAACAFAARFYLFAQKWDKAVSYANTAVGFNPANTLRHWYDDFGSLNQVSDYQTQYISEKKTCNLLIEPLYSDAAYVLGPYNIYLRYGHGYNIYSKETLNVSGPWTKRGGLVISNFVLSNQQKNPTPKLLTHFEYTDKTSQIGYPHIVVVPFTVDESLLVRAEAYTMQKEYGKALRDINDWIIWHSDREKGTVGTDLTENDVNTYFNQLAYQPADLTNEKERSLKKKLNPEGFTVEPGTMENFVHLILQCRRIETIHEGSRWQDIKRYGIEFSHNRAGAKNLVLKKDDPRRAIQLPQDVINAGMKPNPRN